MDIVTTAQMKAIEADAIEKKEFHHFYLWKMQPMV